MPDGPSRIEYRQLLEAATQCEQAVDRLAGDDPGYARAREMLTGMAGYCGRAATVFDLDPTLVDEPAGTGRFRLLDALAEVARHLRSLVGHAVSDQHIDEQDWSAEAEAVYHRAGHLAAMILEVVPRRGHDTVAGSQAISRTRLASRYSDVSDAADTIRAAVADAMRLPHPAPQALALAELADQLEQHATELAALWHAKPDIYTAVLQSIP